MRLIDADALMDALGIADECKDCSRNGTFGCKEDSAFVYACEAITEAPTIDPVKHGRWEKLDLWTKPVCSVCGEPCFGLHGFSYETTTYCPNCGARMEGEEG